MNNKLQFVIEFLTKGKKDLEDAKKALKGTNEELKETEKGTNIFARGLGKVKTAIISTGIGALILAITALISAFKSTEAGQNKFAKLMNAIGVIVGNVTDLLSKLGNAIYDAFTHPKEAIEKFKEAIKKNIETRIKSTIEMFGLLGKAVMKVFKGDFKGALDTAKEAANKYVDSVTGVENTLKKATKAVGGFINENVKEIKISNKLSDLQASIDKRQRALIVERAKIESEVARLRLESNNREKYSAEERMQMLKKAMELNETIYQKEKSIAEDRLKIIHERNKLSGSTKEDLDEEARLQAELIRLAKERDMANVRMMSREQSLREEGLKEKEKEKQEKEKELQEKQKLDAEEIQKEIEKQKELQKIKQEFNEKNYRMTTSIYQQQLDAIDEYYEENKQKLIEAGITEEQIEEQKEMAKERIRQRYKKQALDSVSSTLGSIANIMKTQGKAGFEAYKAMSIAQATIDTYESAVAAYKSVVGIPVVGPALAVAAAGAAVAAGMVNINNIRKQTYKAAKGAMIGGKPHSQGGTLIEAEKDEIILTKGVSQNPVLRKIANTINMAAGGDDITGDSPVMSGGGTVGSISVSGGNNILKEINNNIKALNENIIKNRPIINIKVETVDSELKIRKDENLKRNMQNRGDDLSGDNE